MNKKLDSFSKCHIENTSCQPNNEKKNFETLQDSVKFLQEELAAKNDVMKHLMETQTPILGCMLLLCHDAFQIESPFYSCQNVKELLARNRRHIFG